jgi:DNA-directed RNA polymerase subunit RPC12/RpoP
MVVASFKCQMCGEHFQKEMFDKDDPNERDRHGSPIQCPKCNSREIEVLRILRRIPSTR